jgi:hypothetical protein
MAGSFLRRAVRGLALDSPVRWPGLPADLKPEEKQPPGKVDPRQMHY